MEILLMKFRTQLHIFLKIISSDYEKEDQELDDHPKLMILLQFTH